MRLFVAVDISDDLRDKIEGVLRRISDVGGVKAVEKENLHITLKFIGEVSEARAVAIAEALKKVEFEPFNIYLRGFGFFPNERSPRVAWIGVREGEEELRKLALEVNSVLKKLGFKQEENFKGHVTIARIKRPEGRDRILKILSELDDDFGEMAVRSFKLKKSTLTPKGPIYEDVEVYGVGDEGGH